MEDPKPVHLTRPVRCMVKLGGAAITCKNELEKINSDNLEILASQLRQAIVGEPCDSQKVVSLDWSRRPGNSEACYDVEDDFEGQRLLDSSTGLVVVHGAGSFGHFQASKSGVHKGGLNQPLVKAGFVATRISVTTLNLEIVRALAREGVPSIGMSPFSCGWLTSGRNFAMADLSMVTKAIESGFVPVLHGDAVLDDSQGCTILSGDVIIRCLAAYFKPEYVVFLIKTDVLGVYDRPPSEPDALLLREIAVREDGSWSVVKPTLQNTRKQGLDSLNITVAAHDSTGGMKTKISEAAMIARLGIDVYIVKVRTEDDIPPTAACHREVLWFNAGSNAAFSEGLEWTNEGHNP